MKQIIIILLLAIGAFADEYWVFLQRNNQLMPEPVYKGNDYSTATREMCRILGSTGSDPVVFLYKGECKYSQKSNRFECKEFIMSYTEWHSADNCK